MYLSRVILNTQREGARRLISSPQRMHAGVMKSFSDWALRETSTQGRPLWRLDQNGKDTLLYVLSPAQPDFTHLVEQAGRKNDQYGVATKDYAPVLKNIEDGKEYLFKTVLNPVKTIQGKRVPHLTNVQRKQWLIARSETHGFRVEETQFDNTKNTELRFTKQAEGKTLQVSLSQATFQGHLTVTNTDLFKKTLCEGLGKGKAYGMGLITLAIP
jgi:CRISPR system Cascade subunit CasE